MPLRVMNTDLDDLIFFGTICYRHKRDVEAISTLREIIDIDPCFDKVRRVLFQAIYKQVIDSMRESLRSLTSYHAMEEELGHMEQANILNKKKEEIVGKLLPMCKEPIQLIDQILLPNATDTQTIVYFHKLKGDIYRYIAEYSDESESVSAGNLAEESYAKAYEIADQNLERSDPVKLSLVLNAAVFKYEIRQDMETAAEMLQAEIDEFPNYQNSIEDVNVQKEIIDIIVIMRKNLNDWMEEREEQQYMENDE